MLIKPTKSFWVFELSVQDNQLQENGASVRIWYCEHCVHVLLTYWRCFFFYGANVLLEISKHLKHWIHFGFWPTLHTTKTDAELKTFFQRAWLTKHHVTVREIGSYICKSDSEWCSHDHFINQEKLVKSQSVSVVKGLFKHPSMICPNPPIFSGKLWDFPSLISVCLSAVKWKLQILEKTLSTNIKFRK